jgi:hypothetical protein
VALHTLGRKKLRCSGLGSKDLETKDLAGRCASRATNIRQPALLIRLQASGLRNVFRGSPGSVIPPITALLLHYRQSDLDSQRLSGRGQMAILQPDVLLASRPFQRDSELARCSIEVISKFRENLVCAVATMSLNGYMQNEDPCERVRFRDLHAL